MDQEVIDVALNNIMGLPVNLRDGVIKLAQAIAEMTVEERAELQRTVERVARFAPKRIRRTDAPPMKRRGRPPKVQVVA